MRVITFYSYKGGVGRTLACANFGLYLAKTGQKVVLADMDFEAPGLDSKFPNVDVSKIQGGVIDLFCGFQNGESRPELNPVEIPLPDDVSRSGGRLQLIPAGNYLSPDYFKKLSSINWETFLNDELGMAFCLDLVKRIKEELDADVFVIDSRTGLTEIGGLCTQVFPDTVLLFTCASPESIAGTKRIYSKIKDSPIIKKRHGGRDKVDLQVVIARIPRPDDLSVLDQDMKDRVGIDVDRLYYLFDQRDLSYEEYLALDRFAEEHPAILDDYVELFASFNPEFTLPYIEKRLDNFRLNLTRRSLEENERIIKELLTLFPVPEVFLEAARYYRLAKGGDSETINNYIKYLDQKVNDFDVLSEFVKLSETVDETELKPRKKVLSLFERYGIDKLSSKLMNICFNLSQENGDYQKIIDALEKNDDKLKNTDYRNVYFRTLESLEEWEKITVNALEKDYSSRLIIPILAKSFSEQGDISNTINLLKKFDLHHLRRTKYIFQLWEIYYKLFPEIDNLDQLIQLLKSNETDEKYLFLMEDSLHYAMKEARKDDFRHWLKVLLMKLRKNIK